MRWWYTASMTELLIALGGLLLGAALGFAFSQARNRAALAQEQLAAQEREQQAQADLQKVQLELAGATARADALIAGHEAEKRSSEDLRRELRDSFQALAGQALKDNSTALLEKTDLKLKPFEKQLTSLAEQTLELEKARSRTAGELKEQLQALKMSTVELERRSLDVATALRGSSQARGQWGEMVLARVFELAGMTEGVHYKPQSQIEGGLRPDFQVFLPGGESAIAVDAKVPMAAFLDAQGENDPARRKAFLEKHTQDLRKHVSALCKKDYAANMEGEVDYTVMFLPGDHLLEAAFHSAPHLQEEAMERGILIATPVTLLALLKTVSMYWKHDKLAQNAQEIANVAKEYHKRMRTFVGHIEKTGAGLRSAVKAYNSSVGSYQKQVLPQGRRLEEMAHIEPNRTIEEPQLVEQEPREDSLME
jgi:DNA recombination protein RmuC